MTNGKHPDIPRIVRDTPHKVAVIYGGKMYRWLRCGYRECATWFWKNTTGRFNTGTANGKYAVYCSDECRVANSKILNRERQRRWKKRRANGLITTT